MTSSAAAMSHVSAMQRRTCPATNVHTGIGVARRRLSWPVSRCAVSPTTRLVNACCATAKAVMPAVK
jgi:hypothetical protein